MFISAKRLYTVTTLYEYKTKTFYIFRKGLFIMRKMFYVMCAAGVAASLAGCTKMDTAATTAAPAATEAADKGGNESRRKKQKQQQNQR